MFIILPEFTAGYHDYAVEFLCLMLIWHNFDPQIYYLNIEKKIVKKS